MAEQSGWDTIWAVNASFLRVAAAGAIGWACWEASAARGYELLAYLAAVAGVVVVKHGAIGLYHLARLALKPRKWARFRRQGVEPKADRLAGDAELRERGLM